MTRRRTVDQFVESAERDRLARLPQQVRRALLTGSHSLKVLAVDLRTTVARLHELIAEFREAGANVVERAGRWSIEKFFAPSDKRWVEDTQSGQAFRFGLIADTHLGSKHQRLDVCEALYDWYAASGVRTVYHCGNWIEGEARFNRHELVRGAHGMQEQVDYFVENYPQREGIVTRYVAGDDHEGWYAQREGVDIGALLESTARRAGRSDLVHLGYKEAFIELRNERGKSARMLIDHPGGGSSYAVSYAPQKRVESAQGGEKPAIWCFGHWHKSGYFVVRNVHCILVPCTKDLDTFGRKKGLEYVIGGVIVDAVQDKAGAVVQVTPQFRLFFDRGYLNRQFSLAGPLDSESKRSEPERPARRGKRGVR